MNPQFVAFHNVNRINTLWQIDTMERDPRRKNIRLGFFLHSFSPQIYSIIFDITVRKLSLIYSAHFLSNCWCIWLKLMNSMTWLGNHFSSNVIHISRVICNSVRQTGPKFGKKSIWLPYFIAFWFWYEEWAFRKMCFNLGTTVVTHGNYKTFFDVCCYPSTNFKKSCVSYIICNVAWYL